MNERDDKMVETFRAEVWAGLAQAQKVIPCRWLYDATGSLLFDHITRLDEYYLTRTELQVLEYHLEDIADFMGRGVPIIEYGAGSDICKSGLVLGKVQPAEYFPVDISAAALRTAASVRDHCPDVRIIPIVGDFMGALSSLPKASNRRTAYFPGSTIGNLNDAEIDLFLKRVAEHTGQGGRALIGFDMCQRADVLTPAYNDREGVTAAFSLNVLERINRELSGDFRLDLFLHDARWNERLSAIEMHLVSKVHQEVHVAGKSFSLKAGESIITEWSRKFALHDIAALSERNHWRVIASWHDPDHRFGLIGLEQVPQQQPLSFRRTESRDTLSLD